MGPEPQIGDLLYSLDGFIGMIVSVHEADDNQRFYGPAVYDVEWYDVKAHKNILIRRQYADIVYDMRANYIKYRDWLLS